uniref:Putative secreted peptide n=1 Tax=Anopheles braziliensis TaxID=58242 RepID=A0A2M3ZU48_9DIPT
MGANCVLGSTLLRLLSGCCTAAFTRVCFIAMRWHRIDGHLVLFAFLQLFCPLSRIACTGFCHFLTTRSSGDCGGTSLFALQSYFNRWRY